ncbi:hypothetical protein [Jeotgalibacillus marinus]|uniref:DUF4203 domain-containing protein n=1 Tax=Jeotgalibacillus marinus TaxID=86667 RepID=A0ABV3Q7Z1_9BACL
MMTSNIEIFFIIALISLVIIAIFASITLVLSLKKENRACCIGAGILLAITSIALGILVFTGGLLFIVSILSFDFFEILVIVSSFFLFIIALFASLFTLLAVKKNVKFCCLGGGIALAGIGIGVGLILSVSIFLFLFGVPLFIFIVLSIITLALISIVAFIVILVSLKKCEGLCCLAGSISLVGVVIGWSLFGFFTVLVLFVFAPPVDIFGSMDIFG